MTLTNDPSATALYSPRQIALAALLGTPVAAGWLCHRNFVVLADDQRATWVLWIGIGATVVVFAIAFVVPPNFPDALMPALYTAAAHQYASVVFGKPFKDHISGGGRKGSWWVVVGVGLFALLVVLGVIFALVWAIPSLLPK